jgi:hypothetical protein
MCVIQFWKTAFSHSNLKFPLHVDGGNVMEENHLVIPEKHGMNQSKVDHHSPNK